MMCEPRAVAKVTDGAGKNCGPGRQVRAGDQEGSGAGREPHPGTVIVKGSTYQRGIGLPTRTTAKTGTADNFHQASISATPRVCHRVLGGQLRLPLAPSTV
ncbi:hypothetical protein QJS66_18535 [Kocuria rhizophila]|nr:hypothetical protein QJS66_18535 [Kocuria rhizophila]